MKMAHVTPGRSARVIVAVQPSLVNRTGPRTLSLSTQNVSPRDRRAKQVVSMIVVYFTLSAQYRSSAVIKFLKPDFIDSIRARSTRFAPSAFMRESPAALPFFAVSVRPATRISLKSPDMAVAEAWFPPLLMRHAFKRGLLLSPSLPAGPSPPAHS